MNDQTLNLINDASNSQDGPFDNKTTRLHRDHSIMNNEERQFALANLFESLSNLSNLANNNNSNQTHQVYPPEPRMSHESLNLQQFPTTNDESLFAQRSLQSAMVAAVMQQHLTSGSTRLQAYDPETTRAKPIANSVAYIPPDLSITSNLLGRCQARLDRDLANSTIGLGQQIKLDNNFPQKHPIPQQTHVPTQQRINYCTICNKELCNKYFMKTHMLKMHQINLESEQPAVHDDDSDPSNSDTESPDKSKSSKDHQNHETQIDQSSADTASDLSAKSSNNNNVSQARNGKKSTSSANRQATSVMNGFAGNSMGGVVCDICNKELCSKYFLKVHKQNTHGISTDQYQDASQLMYPFASPIGQTGQFLSPTTPMASSGPFVSPSNPLALLTGSLFQQQPNQHQLNHDQQQDFSLSEKGHSHVAKKVRLSNYSKQSSNQLPLNVLLDKTIPQTGDLAKQCDPIYRLLQQSQSQLNPLSTCLNPLGPMVDPSHSNPLITLMRLGAPAGPFCPAGISPAMIVDNILKNQHIISRNNASNQVVNSGKVKNEDSVSVTNPDTNNNGLEASTNISPPGNSSGSDQKVVEACPMCDRRFKSIKWLRTHMMNDHKQEINSYMQMMIQYFYTDKSQQMAAAAAAATMAALNQQQQQQQNLLQQTLHH